MGCKARDFDFFDGIGRGCSISGPTATATAGGGGDPKALEHREGDDIAEDDDKEGEGEPGAESSGVSASSVFGSGPLVGEAMSTSHPAVFLLVRLSLPRSTRCRSSVSLADALALDSSNERLGDRVVRYGGCG